MPKTETPGTGVFLPLSFPAPAPSDDPAQQGQTAVAQQSKPAGHHHKAAVGRSHTFSAGVQGSKSQDIAAPDSNPLGAAPQHGHHTHGPAHRYHSFSYFSPREQQPQQQWADTTARAPAAPQLRPRTTTGTGWAAGPNTPLLQPRVMAEGSPSSGSSNSRNAWAIDLPNCSSVRAVASGAYSSACLPLAVSPTATAAGVGSTVLGMAGSSSISSSSYCDAPRGSWSSSGCSSGRSSTDARGTSATSAAYHSAFYHSSQLQLAGPSAAAGPSCSTAAPAAGSGAIGYHRLLPVQPGEEQHHSCHSLGFDPAASHSGLLTQQLQPSMFGATDLVTAGSLTTSSSDLSLPLLLAHDSARLQLLQQLQQAPSALDLEEQINKELLWLLELRQRLTQTSPSASAAKAAGRTAAGSTSDSCVQGRAAHYQQVMMPMRGGHPHQPACWFDDSAGRIHSRAPAACAAGFSNGSSATLQPAVGAGPAAVVLQRAHSGGLGSRLPSGSLGLPGAGSSSSNSLGSCSTSNRGASNGEQPTVIADMATASADVAAVVQTKLQQLQMIQELQGDLEAELLQLLPM